MLQKNYWLDYSPDKKVKREMKFRTLFCKHQFPSSANFYNRAFMMFDGGKISGINAWTISINECSILRPGAVHNLADETIDQIRRILILKTNLLFAESPNEINRFHDRDSILSEFFNKNEQDLHGVVEDLNRWIVKILSFERKLYKSFCTALAAYEKALQVFSSDPTLSYSLLVFILESLANSDSNHQATWDHISPEERNKFELLFKDSRFSSVDSTWVDELKKAIVTTLHPKASKRFNEFVLKHIPIGFYDSQNNISQSPIRHSRIDHSIQNAHSLRSSFAHELKPLTQYLISESKVAEEVEENNTTYLTLRGLFRLVRSVMLEFIERQDTKNLQKYNWDNEFSNGIITITKPAFYRVRNPNDNQLLPVELESARTRLEEILVIYQDNYVEFLHKTNHENLFKGFGTHGDTAGIAIFSYDPHPSYDWMIWKDQSLAVLNNPKTKKFKGCLQAIAILCAYLEAIDKEDSQMNKINELISREQMGDSLKEIENFVVDTICKTGNTYTGEESEKLLEKHIKKRKIRLPSRIEIACMLEVARLFQNEGIIEKRNHWLEYVYGDSAQYPDFQRSVKDALACNETLIEPQEILNVSPIIMEPA